MWCGNSLVIMIMLEIEVKIMGMIIIVIVVSRFMLLCRWFISMKVGNIRMISVRCD